jgi:outer membrane protein TolC
MRGRPAGWIACCFCAVALGGDVTGAEATNAAVYPIDLPTALRLAGAQNLDVQLARERLRESEANRLAALEQFFPWVGPGIQYHRRDGLAQAVPAGTISEAHFDSYAPGATLAAQVSLGEAIYSTLAAKQLLRASDQALEAQRQDSIEAAAQRYFDLSKAKAQGDVLAQAVKTSQDYQQQLHAAVGAGIAFRGDELRVQTQTERYQITLRQRMEDQRLAAARLAQVLHLDPAVELVPRDTGLERLTLIETNAPLSVLVEQALQTRPELKQSHALVGASQAARRGAVYGPLVPSIGAQVFAGGLGGGPDGGPSRFGSEEDYLVGLTWRIGPGGLFDLGRVRISQARLEAARLTLSKWKDTIATEVVSGLTRVQSLADQIALAERNLSTATEALRLTRERKQYGVGVVLEDIKAQQDLTQARSEYVTALAEFNKAQFALRKAVGGESTMPKQR